MKLRILLSSAVLAALLLALVAFSGQCASVAMQSSMTPAPVSRGELISIDVVMDNLSLDALADTTLFAPLPVGVDQWTAQVSISGGPWESYPANGLIALPPVAAGGQLVVDIQTLVESGSPEALAMTAQWLQATGILAESTNWANVTPSVDAGPDAIANLGDSMTLVDSSVTDGGGAIASLHWTDHGAGGHFDNAGTLHPTYTPPETSGVVELSLTATDKDGGQSVDSLRLRVNAIPFVSLGEDLQVSEGASIAIQGVSATDADGWISTLVWNDGGAGGTFLPSTDVIDPIYVAPAIPGCDDAIITLSLIGTDDWGAMGTDSLHLVVTNENQPPTVHVPTSMHADAGQQIELSAIASDDDGWIDSQSWEQVAGTPIDIVGGNVGTDILLALPAVAEQADVVFRFAAIDNCGANQWADVVLTIVPEKTSPPSPALESGAMRLDLALFDERGVSLSPFDSPPRGEPITAKLTVSNTGNTRLANLTAYLRGGSSISLLTDALDPWRSTTGIGVWLDASWDGMEIEAVVQAMDETGQWITATDVIEFFGNASTDESAITLDITPSVSQALTDQTIIYTFRIANVGSSPLDGLSLRDDLLGWIDTPADVLLVDGAFEIHVPYTIREDDLPGPLTSRATAVAFSTQGQRSEASASSYVTLADAASDGGGGTASSSRRSRVVISEIAWAGSPTNPAAEWIELANIGTDAVDLTGWVLAWHEKGDEVPPASQWHSIKLGGSIQPLEQIERGQEDLQFAPLDNGLWAIQDRVWQLPNASSGYLLLERGNDAVVADVQAGIVYGHADNPHDQLPDAGATLWLLDADGVIVDSANAQYATRSGWPAGKLATCATMERIHLDEGDYDGNWQTTSGVMTYGHDASGHRLLATAGMANSFSLSLLLDAATTAVPGIPAPARISVPIPTTDHAGMPTIHVTALAAGGGGGAASVPSISTTRQLDTLTMTVDLEQAIRGAYFVWIVPENGEALVLPLIK